MTEDDIDLELEAEIGIGDDELEMELGDSRTGEASLRTDALDVAVSMSATVDGED